MCCYVVGLFVMLPFLLCFTVSVAALTSLMSLVSGLGPSCVSL